MKKIYTLLLVLSCISLKTQVFAQKKQYMVFFTDKDNSAFSISKPEKYLSQKSIDRRNKNNLPIDESDLPISQNYLTELEKIGHFPKNKSKWMNAALYYLETSDVANLNTLSFIKKIEYIAPDLGNVRTLRRKSKFELSQNQLIENNTASQTNAFQNSLHNIEALHKDGYTGKGITLAVFDAGFPGMDTISYFKHLYDNNRIIATKDLFTNSDYIYHKHSHGTQVLSAIAAYREDKSYIGMAPDVELILCITDDDSEYRLDEYSWLFAAEFADSLGVDIINSSLGYTTFDDPSMNYNLGLLDGKTAIITQVVELAASKGILVVNAAGNEGQNPILPLSAPADAANILSVGAVNNQLEKAGFSSYGPTADGRIKPDVVAFGAGTVLVSNNGEIIRDSGTSFASPILAGFIASLWQENPEWDTKEMIRQIKASSSQADSPDNFLGHGIPRYELDISPFPETTLDTTAKLNSKSSIHPNPSHGTFYIELSEKDTFDIEIYDNQMKLVYYEKQTNKQKIHANLEVGVYHLIIKTKNWQEAHKILID